MDGLTRQAIRRTHEVKPNLKGLASIWEQLERQVVLELAAVNAASAKRQAIIPDLATLGNSN
jgi:hypothetical protein